MKRFIRLTHDSNVRRTELMVREKKLMTFDSREKKKLRSRS